ncbi:flagellar assembly peptidoglycan hydrolase FlgJ [Pseudomonas sp. 5P_3.1_Bac2]|uniref:flagellar assembly peptidoglycan hydrolase FlgJ n=1 Tax=Pseudomonas sp. 5P_3.1_Bac2 TaxID=2971617 RepID=UPI0021C7C8E2|nr:flagellar assembly peptidoglycan hydrolase FlgJ [Pseudomonas sp. 5P_3.1_Bac2]MCU1716477.1 flagellar assembly peptidoglycan hydrolase FlgJ [Pseudomonas sp. 5P_3.1_Bac2]
MDSRLSAGLLGSGSSPSDSGSVTDLNRLQQFKVGGDSEENIKKVAKEFESLFMNEMLKAMRSANEVFGEGNFMNSNESKTYQDMYDQQLSVTLANNKNGIGLADVLERQMSKLKTRSSRPNPFAQVDQASPAAPSKPLANVDSSRNDAALLNQRRLSLPSKLTDRLLAGIVPNTGAADASNTGQSLAQVDWRTAQAYAAPADKALSINGSDAITGRRVAQPPLAPAKAAFGSKDEFIATMLPMAEQAAQKIGVDPRYLVAQAALETGWGKSIIRQQDGSSSHNLFGIKTHGAWEGESARVLTTEYQDGKAVKEAASFRAYESYSHSFEDYVSFLQGNDRYDKALSKTEKPEQFAQELQKAGYATDPNYARKIAQIARQMQTYQTVAAASVPPAKG